MRSATLSMGRVRELCRFLCLRRLLEALVKAGSEFADSRRLFGSREILDDTRLVHFAALLAELELTLEQLDLHLKTDDAADHAVDVAVGKLVEIVRRLL